MSERIRARFAARRGQGRAVLIAFLIAGDPDFETSLALMQALVAGGVDVVELGYPYAYPSLDGAAVAAANARALASGGSLDAALAQLARFRFADDETPVIAMGYATPIIEHGTRRYADDLAASGGDGTIVADLRLRDARRSLVPALARHGLVLVPLASPNRGPAAPIDDVPGIGGFFYAIPVEGLTGGGPPPTVAVARAVAASRAFTKLPVAVGFGVRTPAQAAEVARLADAVVVGSALVDIIAAYATTGDGPARLTERARAFREAIDAGR